MSESKFARGVVQVSIVDGVAKVVFGVRDDIESLGMSTLEYMARAGFGALRDSRASASSDSITWTVAGAKSGEFTERHADAAALHAAEPCEKHFWVDCNTLTSHEALFAAFRVLCDAAKENGVRASFHLDTSVGG